MFDISTNKRQIGLNFNNKGKATMVLWATYARNVELEVNSKESFALHRDQRGYWLATIPQINHGDRYSIILNGKTKLPDPASLGQPDGVHQPSMAIDLEKIKPQFITWQGIPLNDLIIYELHAGTFTGNGTFKAIHEKLNYLKELGVNAIELMPVAQFPGTRNWGYDGVFPFAVQNSYGGAKELMHLIDSCHKNGLAVILDVVYNHLGPEGNYLDKFAPYFTTKYKTPWGKAVNFDDSGCDEVRRFFIENALMWLRDFNVDGLRLDAIHAIQDFSPKHFLKELKEYVDKLNKQTGKNHFLIGESDLNNVKYINPFKYCGYGLDSQWTDCFHHSLHALITGERDGYYSDYGSTEHLVKSFNNAYVYDGIYSNYRGKTFGTNTTGQPGSRFIVYSQNHDQIGNRLLGERLSSLVNYETLKLAATTLLISPFVPMLFMGEEYGEDNPFLYFISHGDEQLVEKIREGRKKEFRDFFKSKEPQDPQAEKAFLDSKLKWDFNDGPKKKKMLDFYKKLIELRKNQPLLKSLDRENRTTYLPENQSVVIHNSKNEEDVLYVVINFSDNTHKVTIPELSGNNYDLLLYSAHQKWGGNVDDNSNHIFNFNNNSFEASLEKQSAIIIKSKRFKNKLI